MTASKLARFVAGAVTAAAILHLLTATAAAWAMHELYQHRIFNARAWSDSASDPYRLVGTFLVERTRDRSLPVIAFAGSSVTFGYPWAERFIFSRLFAAQKPRDRVINASIVGTSLSGINDWIVCAAARNAVHLDALIIEIPVVNTTSQLVGRRRVHQLGPTLQPCADGPADHGYWYLTAMHPRGIGWLGFLSNRDSRDSVEVAAQVNRVEPGYFASDRDFTAIHADYRAAIAETLTNAKRVADAVYVFPSPVFLGGLDEIGEDAAAIRRQLTDTDEACHAVAEVRCVDTSSIWMERSFYFNLTHLSQAGHQAMADLLAAQIGS